MPGGPSLGSLLPSPSRFSAWSLPSLIRLGATLACVCLGRGLQQAAHRSFPGGTLLCFSPLSWADSSLSSVPRSQQKHPLPTPVGGPRLPQAESCCDSSRGGTFAVHLCVTIWNRRRLPSLHAMRDPTPHSHMHVTVPCQHPDKAVTRGQCGVGAGL